LDEPGLEPTNFISNLGRRDLVPHHFIQIFADDMNPPESDSG
jgi:hypothetical protein